MTKIFIISSLAGAILLTASIASPTSAKTVKCFFSSSPEFTMGTPGKPDFIKIPAEPGFKGKCEYREIDVNGSFEISAEKGTDKFVAGMKALGVIVTSPGKGISIARASNGQYSRGDSRVQSKKDPACWFFGEKPVGGKMCAWK